MDWQRVKIFACALMVGNNKESLIRQGYFKDASDEEAWELASSDPARYADQEIEADIGVSSELPPEIVDYLRQHGNWID